MTLVLGGAASGKSVFAENLLLNSGLRPVYLATGQAWDDETQAKIDIHKSRRNDNWQTVETPVAIAAPLAERRTGEAVLIDCATMWLSNMMLADAQLETMNEVFLGAVQACPVPVVVVSNEVGQGIVPENALARRFREAQGRLNIALAQKADCAVQIVAGLPNVLKGALL